MLEPSHTIATSAATEACGKGGREDPRDSMQSRGGDVEMRVGGRYAEEEEEEEDSRGTQRLGSILKSGLWPSGKASEKGGMIW